MYWRHSKSQFLNFTFKDVFYDILSQYRCTEESCRCFHKETALLINLLSYFIRKHSAGGERHRIPEMIHLFIKLFSVSSVFLKTGIREYIEAIIRPTLAA